MFYTKHLQKILITLNLRKTGNIKVSQDSRSVFCGYKIVFNGLGQVVQQAYRQKQLVLKIHTLS